MATYQRIEYRIGKDGRVVETVIGGEGASCVAATEEIEAAMGRIEEREWLPEYYDRADELNTQVDQQVQQ